MVTKQGELGVTVGPENDLIKELAPVVLGIQQVRGVAELLELGIPPGRVPTDHDEASVVSNDDVHALKVAMRKDGHAVSLKVGAVDALPALQEALPCFKTARGRRPKRLRPDPAQGVAKLLPGLVRGPDLGLRIRFAVGAAYELEGFVRLLL